MDKNRGKLSLEHTHELIDLLEELEQIPHPMAEKLFAKFQDFIAREGFNESGFDPRDKAECSICLGGFDYSDITEIGLGSGIYQCEKCWNEFGEEL
jgi:hypothetical protein